MVTDADFTVNVPLGPLALRDADTVIVPAAVEDHGPQQQGRLRPLAEAALAEEPATARLASSCTGSTTEGC
ncbi:hypothetical protein SMA5143A_8019 [Streptomyces sp. MA5143a]|nr:hypothetical protein SMA5143A_8019 [Streptomyces sp. MA5143a]